MAITILSSAQCRTDFNFVRTFTGSRFLFHCICAIRLRKFSQLYANMPQRLITIFIGTLFAESLYAQTFSELEAKLQKHPQLQSLSYQADSQRQQSTASMGLPDPVVSLGINNFPVFDPSFDEFLPTNKAIGVRQRFPNRATRRARAKSISAEAEQSDQLREQTLAAMRAELVSLLHNKVRITKQRAFAQQRDKKYSQLADVIESEVGSGRTSVFRLAEVEAERAEVARTLIDLQAQTEQLDARLRYLVDEVPITIPPELNPADWSGSTQDFYATRVADSALKVSESGIDEAKAAWKPEWGAQLTYQQREAGRNFDGDDWASVMVTFTVPFWGKDKQAPALRAAQARQQAAKQRVSETHRKALSLYSSAMATYVAANKTKGVFEQKITAIEQEIAAQQSRYESGDGNYVPVLDGEIAILKLRAEIAEEHARGQMAAAQMKALLVTP